MDHVNIDAAGNSIPHKAVISLPHGAGRMGIYCLRLLSRKSLDRSCIQLSVFLGAFLYYNFVQFLQTNIEEFLKTLLTAFLTRECVTRRSEALKVNFGQRDFQFNFQVCLHP